MPELIDNQLEIHNESTISNENIIMKTYYMQCRPMLFHVPEIKNEIDRNIELVLLFYLRNNEFFFRCFQIG